MFDGSLQCCRSVDKKGRLTGMRKERRNNCEGHGWVVREVRVPPVKREWRPLSCPTDRGLYTSFSALLWFVWRCLERLGDDHRKPIIPSACACLIAAAPRCIEPFQPCTRPLVVSYVVL